MRLWEYVQGFDLKKIFMSELVHLYSWVKVSPSKITHSMSITFEMSILMHWLVIKQ